MLRGLRPRHPFGFGHPHTASRMPSRPTSRHVQRENDHGDADELLEPQITRKTSFNNHRVTLLPPPGAELSQPRATVDGHDLLLTGVLSVPEPDRLQYVLTQPSALYDGDGEMLGYLRAGTRVSGSTRGLPRGWIALDDEDDAYMKLADLRPLAPPRPSPRRFSRLVRLPADAELDLARAESIRGGGLRVTVPKRPAPPQVTAAKRAAPAPAAPRRAAAPAPAAPPTPAPSPEPAKAKKAAAPPPQRRATETAGGALPSSQVLVECAASATNVQSPKEFVEHWKATPEGGFKMTK